MDNFHCLDVDESVAEFNSTLNSHKNEHYGNTEQYLKKAVNSFEID